MAEWKVLIAHAEGEENLAEELAEPITRAGYDVGHRGTVCIGESIIEEASKCMRKGGPVVLCGTIKALGTPWAHRVVNAARQNGARVFPVQMQKDAYMQLLSLDEAVAVYWQDPSKAKDKLIASLKKHYPLDDDSTSRLPGSSTRNCIVRVESLQEISKYDRKLQRLLRSIERKENIETKEFVIKET